MSTLLQLDPLGERLHALSHLAHLLIGGGGTGIAGRRSCRSFGRRREACLLWTFASFARSGHLPFARHGAGCPLDRRDQGRAIAREVLHEAQSFVEREDRHPVARGQVTLHVVERGSRGKLTTVLTQMIEDERDERDLPQRIGLTRSDRCRRRRRDRAGHRRPLDQPERSHLARHAVLEHRDLVLAQVAYRAPAAVTDDDVEDDGVGAGAESRLRRRLLPRGRTTGVEARRQDDSQRESRCR